MHLHSRGGAPDKSEAAQLVAYLDRLQQLVPECPKNKPVSKLQLIQSVIDYIYDLEDVLLESEEEDGPRTKESPSFGDSSSDEEEFCSSAVTEITAVTSLWSRDNSIVSEDSSEMLLSTFNDSPTKSPFPMTPL
ncbi:UNVERIFIED_CONTAM: hypothetical protein GTU68_004929 [Idotea baltica]|nr:hypothetical protein [Idotea baltica]